MADERVVIKIEVKSDDRDIDRTRRKLERLAGARDRDRKSKSKSDGLASRARKTEDKLARTGHKSMESVSRKYKKSFDSYDKMIKMTGGMMMKFLAMSAKAVALEFAVMGAAMIGVHAAFAAGQMIMRGYKNVMSLAAGAMASFVIAAGTVAAALREQQAAMYAFSAKGVATEFGSGLNQARMQMRALTMDADLASVGVENLAAAYGEISKNSKFTSASKETLKGLMDFASAGMDMKEGTKAAGSLIATLQDTKKSYADVVSAGKKFSPQMKKALEEYEKTKGKKGGTKEALTAAITSGELAKLGGVDGQFEAVSGTLINTLKGQLTMMRGLFGDFGQQFLEPVKKEAREVFEIMRTSLFRMSGDIADFGKSGFIDKISVVVQKVADLSVRLIRDYLPNAVGIFERFGKFWDRFKDGWNAMLDGLRPLIAGAKVLENMVMNIFRPIGTYLKDSFGEFNQLVQDNAIPLEEFGTNIGNLITKVMEYFGEARKLFFEALPFINKVIQGFTSMIELFTSFLGKFMSLTKALPGGMGGAGSLMMLIGLARGMKNTKGYFTRDQSRSGIREVADMSVRAGVVNINGKPVAQYGPKGSGGTAGPLTAKSNTINTMPGYRGGPYMGPPGTRGGSGGGGTGLASRGAGSAPLTKADRTQMRSQFGGSVRAGSGPNGGHLITSGPNKGKEILTQNVRGKSVQYMYGGRGTGRENYSQKNLNGVSYKSGVTVAGDQRMKGNTKIVDATGRIITRREQLARSVGEGQTHGASGFRRDGTPKTMFDRMLGKNTGVGGFVGGRADAYRDRMVNKSKYLGPSGPPINPKTGKPFTPSSKTYKAWKLSSNAAYGPGTYDPTSMKGKYLNSKLYNNWLSPKSDIGSKGGPLQRGRVGTFLQNQRLNSRDARASRLGGAIFGNESRKGFQGSAAGSMGTMMGLSMLANSGMVSEKASGFLSAGSMIGMMNPLAGLAVGLGGTALTAETAKGGAVAGAGAGAAIGTMIAPGFGTAAGAIIGAAVGGLMGRVNRIKKEKKQSKEAFESVFDQLVTKQLGIAQQEMIASGFRGESALIKTNTRSQANQQFLTDKAASMSEADFAKYLTDNADDLGVNLTTEQKDAMKKTPGESAKVLQDVGKKQMAQNHLMEIYQKRLKELTAITGKTEQEIEQMAMTTGVDLFDATKDFTKQMEELGVATLKTREQLRGVQMDLALKGLEVFQKRVDELKLPEILDEQARAFGDLQRSVGGDVNEEQLATFMSDFMPNFLTYVGGGFQGLLEAKKQFGVGGKAFTQIDEKGNKGNFYGMEEKFTTGATGQLVQNYINDGIMNAGKEQGGNINAQLLKSGPGADAFRIDSGMFADAMAGMDPDKGAALASALESGTFFAGLDMETLTKEQFADRLNTYGMDSGLVGLQDRAKNDELGMIIDGLPTELKDSYGAIIEMFGTFFDTRDSSRPDWYTVEFAKAIADGKLDTSSPRGKGIGDTTSSRLGRTMDRHSAMDGMLTGKRTMTSAYRTTQLGSTNSDHVTGRAYDLVGANLGAYQRLATANGGFAEFHGYGGTRHLHVVPGGGPYGDTGYPAKTSTAPAMASGGGQGISINMNVTGGPNASAEEIATIAVRKMKNQIDNIRQRS
jgi:hypothetical protein